jgi:hypothetical protein
MEERIRALKRVGKPTEIAIVGYDKYVFTVQCQIVGNEVTIECGGDANDIYDFDPYGGWTEWEGAGIRDVTITGATTSTE